MARQFKDKIQTAKGLLALPDLLRKLGFDPPANGEGNMQSPFAAGRVQKTPSFSIFRRNEFWGWCDRTGGEETKGDEISLLEKLEGLSRADAIRRYIALAGMGTESNAPAVSSPASAPDPSFDWQSSVAKFTPDHITQLAKWRGYSREFVEWLHTQSLVGLCKDSYAFPVHTDAGEVVGAHIRPETGRWFYTPRGAGCHPLIIGDVLTAEKTMVIESQWDAFSIMEAMGWHKAVPAGWVILITRGAGNGRFAVRAFGTIYAWPQNDVEKGGKLAGEEWMRDVTTHAPGAVFRVNLPPQHKDANDWMRAEKLDVWASIAGAVEVDKPAKNKPPESAKKSVTQNGNGTSPPVSPFDPAAELEKLGLYWLNGSSSFFWKNEKSGHVRFSEMDKSGVRLKLRVKNYRNNPDPVSAETVSQIDRILDASTELRSVDCAVNIAGTTAGVYDFQGGRVLVRESPHLIAPVAGEFPTINDFLTALLGEGVIRFCCWLKIAFEALRDGERRPGQALIIIGPPDCGKSRIQHQIITPILAGRSADPKSFFFGRTDFNSELIGAEHLLIEEIPSSNRHEERQYFGEKIKEIVANDTHRFHKKNKDAVTVSPFWRLSITLNDNPEKLRCLPPFTDDFAEKIILLKAKLAPEFWTRFDDTPDYRKAFREAIDRELPAFAEYLLSMAVPTGLVSRRYGVQSFIPEDIKQTMFESESEHHLLLLIDKCIFSPDKLENKQWEGSAEDLKQALCAEGSNVKDSAHRLLGLYPIVCGQYLRRLMDKFPARFQKHRSASKREWIIQPPAA
ncbi:MAG: primase-helicase family protein [Chthoniobacteraceae bacterium]